ncbi:putative baseplate assembly protein [Actinomycetospora sp. NBRC 106375]|uniref:baseplate J/gp47 family protein n=1 Tax=Actinomycetospora sp. NBRC 106375 TaxID=3032207 RepID=UPI0024A08161|nr:baseplate J/gp47 family protein [Actinomycetospora sp. NBRC 106375]GLZ48199.1 putative baseplate assembly protein [Actinomycetospora sp. NBRC 106375]
MTAVEDDALAMGVDRETRRAMLAAADAPDLLGVDRVEVLSNLPGRPDTVAGVPPRRTLLVWLVRGPVPDALGADGVAIVGGVRVDPRVNPVRVRWARRADRLATGGSGPVPTAADRALVERTVARQDRPRVLVVRTSSAGDWSTYVLVLRAPVGRSDPPAFDPPLARATFSFTVDLPASLDDRTSPPSTPPVPSPAADYLARDADALRTRLVDRMVSQLPDWQDRSPADPLVTVLELFAGLGDRLAIWQDSVAAEAYLGSARRRASVRRHARLLDYRVHEGCAARTWLAFTVGDTDTDDDDADKVGADVIDLPPGVAVADGPPTGPRSEPGLPPSVADVVADGGTVFETCAPVTVRRARNALPLHSWGDPEHVLPPGTTSAFLAPGPADPGLRAGDVLVLAALGATGVAEDGDPNARHAVRLVADPVVHVDRLADGPVTVLEVRWGRDDALPAALVVARRGADGRPRLAAVALANVVLADHGARTGPEALVPERVPLTGAVLPRLARPDLAWVDPPGAAPSSSVAQAGSPAAADALTPDPYRAAPALLVDDGTRVWTPRPDLLDVGPGAAGVVVEPETDGTCRLRFGDGVSGRRPDPGTALHATYRVGGGAAGNVAAGVLTTILASTVTQARTTARSWTRLRVTNPLPARGGTDPEPLADARERAARAFRTQQRAVTESDHAAAAQDHPGVSRAVARRRWTGSWYVVDVTLDVDGEQSETPAIWSSVARDLEARRMAGVDVALSTPVPVPVEIVMWVHVRPGFPRAQAHALLADAFAAHAGGFFDPARFTFGQPLPAVDVVLAAMAVTGVDWVEVRDDPEHPPERGRTALDNPPRPRFRRWGATPTAPSDRIDVGAREVIRADSDPTRPENGRVEFVLWGGV